MTTARALIATFLLTTPLVSAASTEVSVSAGGQGDFTTVEDALRSNPTETDLTIVLLDDHYPVIRVDRGGNTTIVGGPNRSDVEIDGAESVRPDTQLRVSNLVVGAQGLRAVKGTMHIAETRISAAGPVHNAAIFVSQGASVTADTVVIENWNGGDAPVVIEEGATATFDTVGIFTASGLRAGAIWSRGGTLTADALYITDTRSTAGTGALSLEGGTTTLTYSSFDGAQGQTGGAIRLANNGVLDASDIEFHNGRAPAGAAVLVENGDATLVRTYARGGQADAGAVVWMANGTVKVENADWASNTALAGGAAVHQTGGDLTVAFATWTKNGSPAGAGLRALSGNATLDGVIIAGSEGSALSAASGATIAFNDGLIWSAAAASAIEGNVQMSGDQPFMDPMFVNARLSDFALRATSPALDKGVLGALDPDGTDADAGMFGGPKAWLLGDGDNDGFVYGRDCDDTSADVHEGATDILYDGIDQNCDEKSDFDQDGDGYDASSYGGSDCDDTDSAINPIAVENGGDKVDMNCDGFDHPDADADGWPADLDCDDSNDSVRPDAADAWYDGVDSDCAGNDDYDQDGDGYASEAFGGNDCDDLDARRNPRFPETYGDGIDQDCDGSDVNPNAEQNADEVASVEPGAATPEDGDVIRVDAPADPTMTKSGCSVVAAPVGSLALGLVALVAVGARRRED